MNILHIMKRIIALLISIYTKKNIEVKFRRDYDSPELDAKIKLAFFTPHKKDVKNVIYHIYDMIPQIFSGIEVISNSFMAIPTRFLWAWVQMTKMFGCVGVAQPDFVLFKRRFIDYFIPSIFNFDGPFGVVATVAHELGHHVFYLVNNKKHIYPYGVMRHYLGDILRKMAIAWMDYNREKDIYDSYMLENEEEAVAVIFEYALFYEKKSWPEMQLMAFIESISAMNWYELSGEYEPDVYRMKERELIERIEAIHPIGLKEAVD